MQAIGETSYNRFMELPDELLQGAIDTHIHAGPWPRGAFPRLDPIQVAEQAKAVGMPAVVLYDHTFGNSAGTAWLVSRAVKGIEVFGGLILTTCQGGLNPRAVKNALYYGAGAKFIHFGSDSTYFSASRAGRMMDGKPVLFKDLYPKFAREELARAIQIPLEDPISPELEEILQLVAEHPDVYLNTGHVSGPEVMRVVELAQRYGIKKVIVSHPARAQLTVEQQKEAARRGAFLEGTLIDFNSPRTTFLNYYVEPEYLSGLGRIGGDFDKKPLGVIPWAKEIKEIGVEHFVLATDYGAGSYPTPVEGLRSLIACLLDVEFSPKDIQTMTSLNPKRLLGLA